MNTLSIYTLSVYTLSVYTLSICTLSICTIGDKPCDEPGDKLDDEPGDKPGELNLVCCLLPAACCLLPAVHVSAAAPVHVPALVREQY